MEQQEPLRSHRHDELRCPACGYDKLGSTLMIEGDDRAPGPGDVTVCAECAAVLTYGEGLRLHETPDATIKNALTGEQRAAIANMRAYVMATAPLMKEIRELRAKLDAAEKGRASAEGCYAETLKALAVAGRELALSKVPHGLLYEFLEAWRAVEGHGRPGLYRDSLSEGHLIGKRDELGFALDKIERKARP